MGVDANTLKIATEKVQILLSVLEAIDAATQAIELITPNFTNLDNVAENMSIIISVADNEANINAVKANETNIATIVNIQAMLTSIYNDAGKLTSLFNDKAKLDSLFGDKAKLDSLFGDKITIDTVFQNIVAIQGTLQNATDALDAKNQTLLYRNQAEGFKNEAQAIAGGTVVASNVQFSDLLSLEAWRTNTATAISTINTLLSSNDTSLDQIQELVDFIKANKATLDTLSITNIAGLETALSAKSTEIATHANNVANPHSVTKAQVGLSNVDNTSDALKPLSDVAVTALADKLGISATAANSTKWNGATMYTSTSAASGGVDGDIWFQY